MLSKAAKRSFNVAIVGGGACGIAVLTQILRKIKHGRTIGSISLIEQAQTIGPGLAYSAACKGTRLNMRNETMGLRVDNPLHFAQWMRSQHPDEDLSTYLPRIQYGEYLRSIKVAAHEEAEGLGLNLRTISSEAVSLECDAEGYNIKTVSGEKVEASHVVLALGNFMAPKNDHLVNELGFFPSPWPNDKLKMIPPHSSVGIVGTRLTAIDVALCLAENGHQGNMSLISPSGRLPKVQSVFHAKGRQYKLFELARDVEKEPENALEHVMQIIRAEIESGSGVDWDTVNQRPKDAQQELENDISCAEAGPLPWQDVINATAPVVERYWQSFSAEEKDRFAREYMTTWMIYRHAMPVSTAKRLLELMKKGQLDVAKLSGKIQFAEPGFTIPVAGQPKQAHADYLVEATGSECNPSRVPSKLLHNCLGSQVIEADPQGGIKVNPTTLEASSNLYVMGSLTRGTHFYSSAIDRNVAHAERVVDSIFEEPARKSMHIAFFVGTDLCSQLMVSKLVPQLLYQGHMPYIFLPAHKSSKRAAKFELKELAFFERELLQDHIIPFLRASPTNDQTFLTVDQLRSKYGILVEEVADINDPNFLHELESHHIDVGMSIRCYQKFGADIIRFFDAPRSGLLNLHPGTLPAYRGVMTMIRAMANGEQDFGYSLHRINEDWDAGDIIDVQTGRIPNDKPMLNGATELHDIGVKVALEALDKVGRGQLLPSVPQDPHRKGYFTFPTRDELDEYRSRGLRLVDHNSMLDILVSSFSSLENKQQLSHVLRQATRKWYEQNTPPERAADVNYP